MKLDARRGDIGWYVWHVKECRKVERCVFVDDEAATWGEYPGRFQMMVHAALHGELPVVEHQATAIRIIFAKRLVLIDPIEDGDEGTDSTEALRRDLFNMEPS